MKSLPGQGRTTAFDYINWTLIFLVVLWTTLALFFSIFQCRLNPSAVWGTLDQLRTECFNTWQMFSTFAIFSWIMDIAILIEPLCMVC